MSFFIRSGLLLALFSVQAMADGRYRLELQTGTGHGRQTALVEVLGERLRWSGEAQFANRYGYLLIREGRMFQVMLQPWPMALDVAAAVESFGTQGMAAVGFAPLFESLRGLERSGRHETLAGIRGEVWLARVQIDGEPRRVEVVLDGGQAAIDLRDAIQRTLVTQSRSFRTPMPQGYLALYNALAERGRGVLRYGRALRLLAADPQPPAASRFELP